MMLIGSCNNLRLNSILENWIDWVLHPKWFLPIDHSYQEISILKGMDIQLQVL